MDYAPTAHILTFMFDSDGLPIPAHFDCYLDVNGKDKLSEIYDIDGDNRADLIHMYFDDGYWVTNLYQAKNAHWTRVKNIYKNHQFPIYTRYLFNGSHKAVQPIKGRNPKLFDHSNDSPLLTGKIVSCEWANWQKFEDIQCQILDETGATHDSKPNSWFRFTTCSYVIDDKNGRKITNYRNQDNELKKTLDETVKHGYKVKIYGTNEKILNPEIIWATSEDKMK